MAVPKKKTSHSRTRTRNAHSSLPDSLPHVIADKLNNHSMRHHIKQDGTFRGEQVIRIKERNKNKEENN